MVRFCWVPEYFFLSKCWQKTHTLPWGSVGINTNQSCGFTNNLLEYKFWKAGSRWLKKRTNLYFTQLLSAVSLLWRILGCVRLVYNFALAVRTQTWYEHQERVGYKQTLAMLTNWKKQEDLDFLTEVSSVPHIGSNKVNIFSQK